MFSLEIVSNGQPNIRTAAINAPGKMVYRNQGFDLVEQYGVNACTKAEIVAGFTAEFPGVPFRHLKAGIRVNKPAEMVTALDVLSAEWDRMARAGMDHPEIRNVMINHAAFVGYRA